MIDGITMHQAVRALEEKLSGARIERIYHPTEKLLYFKLKNPSSRWNKLVISIDPSFCSIHPTTLTVENPDQPSGFCMLLRKHIEGGLITGIRQHGHERLVDLFIEAYNDLGVKTTKILHLELMGKYSNVVLTEEGRILDAIYKYPIGVNGFREILARRPYEAPPLVEKLLVGDLDQEALRNALNEALDPAVSLSTFLQSRLQGFSKARINTFLASLSMDRLTIGDLDPERFSRLEEGLQALSSSIDEPDEGILEELDRRYTQYYDASRLGAKRTRLAGIVSRQLKKLGKKEAIHLDKIRQEEDADQIRIKGELLSANLYRLTEKVPYIDLENYYDKDLKTIRVELDEALSPARNVKKYFKKYHKIKEGRKQSEALLEEVRVEIDYMASILSAVESAVDLGDLLEIEEELASLDLVRTVSGKKRKKPAEPHYRRIELENGDLLLVGRNNRQNDFVTFKLASSGDWWFHVKDYPGPHVVLKPAGSEPFPESLREAASYAAADQSGEKVQVVYTQRRHVKKHPGHKLGKAVYTDYRTLVVPGGRP